MDQISTISCAGEAQETNKGKNVELKGNNVKQKEKMSTFAKSLFDIFT